MGVGFTDITCPIQDWLRSVDAAAGLLTIFIRHTSASLTIQENADPDVQRDLLAVMERLAPRTAAYRHDIEGPDDMPAHIKAMLTSTSLGIPVMEGRVMLGKWQAVYLVEHRDQAHEREVMLHYVGSRKRN
jgi:secondary thiamine-phosphate synthase enzyme